MTRRAIILIQIFMIFVKVCFCLFRFVISIIPLSPSILLSNWTFFVCIHKCWELNVDISCNSAVNFINVLLTAFTLPDHKSVKKTVKLSIFFTLLGSTSVKAVRRTLMKLTPGVYVCVCACVLVCFFSLQH